jgi:hypothetical protein
MPISFNLQLWLLLEFVTPLTLASIDFLLLLIFILLTSTKICYCNEMLFGAIMFGLVNWISWKPMHRPVFVKISMPLFSYSPHIYVLYKSVKLLSLLSVSSCHNWVLTSFADQRLIHVTNTHIWGSKFQEYWDSNLLERNTPQFGT